MGLYVGCNIKSICVWGSFFFWNLMVYINVIILLNMFFIVMFFKSFFNFKWNICVIKFGWLVFVWFDNRFFLMFGYFGLYVKVINRFGFLNFFIIVIVFWYIWCMCFGLLINDDGKIIFFLVCLLFVLFVCIVLVSFW